PKIRLNDNVWGPGQTASPADDPIVGPPAWQATTVENVGPCWAQRLIIHELLHWIPGLGILKDVVVNSNRAIDDRGPCPASILDDDYNLHRCYHGVCSLALIAQKPSLGLTNIDNYAYLIRNMGMYYSNLVF